MQHDKFIYKHKVQYYETDKMGITHHSNYIRFMEEARIAFLEKIGYNYERIEAEGVISPVVSISCDYKKSTTYPDEISVEISVLKCSRLKFKFGYTMSSKNNIVCYATSTHCLLDSKGRPINIEKEYTEFFEILQNYITD